MGEAVTAEPTFDHTTMQAEATKIEVAYMDELMNAIVKFSLEAGKELGLNHSQIANALTSSCALMAVNIEKPKDTDRATFDAAIKECVPRLYDAMFSMQDWFSRKSPWRMQSMYMKRAQGFIIEATKERLDS